MMDLVFGLAYVVVLFLGVCIGLAAVVATYLLYRAVRVFKSLKDSMNAEEPIINDGY